MNFIIYDLEATCWNGNAMGKVTEIIEIGAIRMNGYGETTGEYNRFVKPILNPYLSPYCKELTSIEQSDVDRAKTFDIVVEEFQDWIGMLDGEDYLLCSWGAFDKKMLKQDSILHDLNPDWADQHINLKKQFQQIHSLKKPFGLKKAVEKSGFEFDGIHHRAISDAYNLSKLFVKNLDEWMF